MFDNVFENCIALAVLIVLISLLILVNLIYFGIVSLSFSDCIKPILIILIDVFVAWAVLKLLLKL